MVITTKSATLTNYFEFLENFIKENYNNFTLKDLKLFLESLVEKVLSEQNKINERMAKLQQEYLEYQQEQAKVLDLSKKKKKVDKSIPPEKRIKKSILAQKCN